jgi:hypothetical protein
VATPQTRRRPWRASRNSPRSFLVWPHCSDGHPRNLLPVPWRLYGHFRTSREVRLTEDSGHAAMARPSRDDGVTDGLSLTGKCTFPRRDCAHQQALAICLGTESLPGDQIAHLCAVGTRSLAEAASLTCGAGAVRGLLGLIGFFHGFRFLTAYAELTCLWSFGCRKGTCGVVWGSAETVSCRLYLRAGVVQWQNVSFPNRKKSTLYFQYFSFVLLAYCPVYCP